MKQIEYTEKQKIVLEVINEVRNLFYKDYSSYDFQKTDFQKKIDTIKNKYGIREKYLTLREYLREKSIGAYHRFIFTIKGIKINVIGIGEFERLYQPKLLDEYYVIEDKPKSYGCTCENYMCEHYLSLIIKED